MTTVGFSTTPAFDASANNGFDFVMAGNVTSSTLTGTSIGQLLTFVIKQGATAYTFVAPTNINGWIPIDSTVNSISVQQFIVRVDGTIWPLATEIAIILSTLIAIEAEIAALQTGTRGQFTITGAFVGAYGPSVRDTGIPCLVTDVITGSIVDVTNITTYFIYNIGRNPITGNICVNVCNTTGGGGASYATFTMNYAIN